MLSDQLDRVHTLVGRIATEFSSIEMLWYLIFTALLDKVPRPAVDAIFNRFKTGAQQRQLVLDVANAVLPSDPDLLSEIDKLCHRTSDLSGRRNAVVHSTIYIAEFIIPPRIASAGISKPSGLKTAQIEAEVTKIYLDTVELEMDMQALRLRAIKRCDPNFDLAGEMQRLDNSRQKAQRLLQSDPILRAASK